jgi:hypothetical protein
MTPLKTDPKPGTVPTKVIEVLPYETRNKLQVLLWRLEKGKS